MADTVNKLAVLGYPIRHSLSPVIHGEWLQQYFINATYDAVEVAPEALGHFLRHTMFEEGYIGVNLTIPHKEAAMQFVDEIDDTAHAIGAINTIVAYDGKLLGKNTDAYGFMENIREAVLQYPHAPNALVLGAGGAARAVCVALLGAGYRITLANRTQARAEALAAQLGHHHISVVGWERAEDALYTTGLLVNTTSLGMKGQPPLEISLQNLPETSLVTDIVYNPLITPLLAQAQARGNPVVEGLGMLLYQAQQAFYEWFGIRPEVTEALCDRILREL